MIPSPEDIGLTGSGVAGWVGGGIAAVVAAAVGLRSWLSGDASNRAEDSTNIAFLSTLMDQLQRANSRADKFAEERNEAIMEIGELKAQVAMLQATMNNMQAQLDRLMTPPSANLMQPAQRPYLLENPDKVSPEDAARISILNLGILKDVANRLHLLQEWAKKSQQIE